MSIFTVHRPAESNVTVMRPCSRLVFSNPASLIPGFPIVKEKSLDVAKKKTQYA